MNFDSVPLDLWSDVTHLGHRVLRDLDDEEVPAALRRVAASDRLPPPLARALLRELDKNDWLRDKVAEAWHQADHGSASPSERAGALFLDRPDGWEEGMDELTTAASSRDQLAELERLRAESERLGAKLEVARSRAKAAEKRARHAEKESVERTKARKADTKRALRAGSDREADLANRLDLAEKEMENLRDELRAAHERSRVLKSELLRARRTSMPTDGRIPENPWSLREPIALARHLDQLAEASVAGPSEVTAGFEPTGAEPLPKGVRPDDPSMVDWLVSRSTPTTFLVDGYNVTFQLDPAEFHTGELRDRLNQGLARLRHTAPGPTRVIVIYDSDHGHDEGFTGPGGVEVRFTDSDVLADEVILDLVGRLDGLIVAVSSDRFVRENAEVKGALGLWSQAMAGWISR